MNNQLIERIIKILNITAQCIESGDWYAGRDSDIPKKCDTLIAELEQLRNPITIHVPSHPIQDDPYETLKAAAKKQGYDMNYRTVPSSTGYFNAYIFTKDDKKYLSDESLRHKQGELMARYWNGDNTASEPYTVILQGEKASIQQ